jgi:hypothetical protein
MRIAIQGLPSFAEIMAGIVFGSLQPTKEIPMTTRRHALLASASLAFPAFARSPSGAYALKTAPDSRTLAILSKEIRTLHDGLVPGADAAAVIRAMTPQVIEQNFARRSRAAVAALLADMSDSELHLLAQVYTEATDGRPSTLLELLATRLDGTAMAQLAPYFGFAPVYDATWRAASEKTFALELAANSNDMLVATTASSSGPTVDMTIRQIYTYFRTAHYGGLSVKAALYETTSFAATRLALAYGTGYTIGTQISTLLQEHAPSVHNAIGAGIYTMVDTLSSTFQSGNVTLAGSAQRAASVPFDMGSIGLTIGFTGGDYLVVNEWCMVTLGGGSGCPASGCPKVR